MKKMRYYQDFKIILLDSGNYLGYDYYILNLGTHPTAYVDIPKEHKYYKKQYDKIDINVHGGVTYSNNTLTIGNNDVKNGWFIGWDYAHYGDYYGYYKSLKTNSFKESHKWTTEEIYEDVKKVCEQLKRVENKSMFKKIFEFIFRRFK